MNEDCDIVPWGNGLITKFADRSMRLKKELVVIYYLIDQGVAAHFPAELESLSVVY